MIPNPPDLAHFERVALETVSGFPAAFREGARDVVLRVVDWPPADMVEELDLHSPVELTGLYEGIPMTQKSVLDMAPNPDVVWIFREPILDEWRIRDGVELDDLIAHVVVHEFAHHFGWSDEDIAAIDQWWL
ncbi:metallopeptidase family protein [Tropicibacter sp. R16_0]|uniref:metallopeptidase family protein n=1 Tax=Tropicibacter sp. R16_0 TaxID=2821102 RepID=UPI001ADAF0FB|nr:metallopeptidase family protein [Tropicibacter sp. R16_0]MBO9451258.1 metallopeptidase family protein [Tropicibacter sp. R16_0]